VGAGPGRKVKKKVKNYMFFLRNLKIEKKLQMSLWGLPKLALNAYLLFIFIFIKKQEFPIKNFHELYFQYLQSNFISIKNSIYQKITIKAIRIRADKRIGPHNIDILSILFGSLLGDGHAERRIKGNGTRITFYQEASHVSYLL
jgi:hypothetical protein